MGSSVYALFMTSWVLESESTSRALYYEPLYTPRLSAGGLP